MAEGKPSAPVAVVTGCRLVLRDAPGLHLPCGAARLARCARLSPRSSVLATCVSATYAVHSRTRAFLAALLAAAESTTHYVTIFTGAKRIVAAIMKLDCSFLDPVMSPLPSVTVS